MAPEQVHAVPVWRKSARSAQNGNCVEVALGPESVGMRDSKDLGPSIVVSRQAWITFLDAVKQGEFDRD